MVETNGQSDDFQTWSEFSFVRNVQKVYSRQMELSTENLTEGASQIWGGHPSSSHALVRTAVPKPGRCYRSHEGVRTKQAARVVAPKLRCARAADIYCRRNTVSTRNTAAKSRMSAPAR